MAQEKSAFLNEMQEPSLLVWSKLCLLHPAQIFTHPPSSLLTHLHNDGFHLLARMCLAQYETRQSSLLD